jgi:thymidylate synthase
MTVQSGAPLAEEGLELLGVTLSFPAAWEKDSIIEHFGDQQMMREMSKVFFSDATNALGHSYAHLVRGPGGRNDFQDVIALLREQPTTKRAVVTLCGEANFKVPCVNTVQFLVRDGAVQTFYFARGQDVFKKFYADGICLGRMAQTVAHGLELPAGRVNGLIGSSHVYHEDMPAIEQFLANTKSLRRSEYPSVGASVRCLAGHALTREGMS